MQTPRWQGCWVALVTPMTFAGDIDWQAFDQLLIRQIDSGTTGIVLLGTTAESPTLSGEEKKKLLQRAKTILQDRLPIIVGVGSNCTKRTCDAAVSAQQSGADGLMVVTPYYNKPPQRGLIAHFKEVASATDLPLLLYDHPPRTGSCLSMETLQALGEVENICAIKDATGDLGRIKRMHTLLPTWSLLTGNDEQVANFMAFGGHGVVSVAANIVPKKMAAICTAYAKGDNQQGLLYSKQLADLFQVLFCDTNPIAVKWALHAMGLIDIGIRLPLVHLDQSNQKRVLQVLKTLDLI